MLLLLKEMRDEAKLAQRKSDARVTKLSGEVAALSSQLQDVLSRLQ